MSAGPPGSPAEVLRAFLKLGLLSFGGPIAHIGYFRTEFVARRRWLDDPAFGDLVALCQFLPGPASSQVGFGIGLARAGYAGAIAAWIGFTLPSAVMLVLFAFGVSAVNGAAAEGALHGLGLVAVAVVAQAVVGMARSACPDRGRAAIAAVAAALVATSSAGYAQIAAIAGGAVAGLWICRGTAAPARAAAIAASTAVSPWAGAALLAAFVLLLIGSEVPPNFFGAGAARGEFPALALAQAFYRSGALVFGGGHVVLPLLRDAFVAPGWVSDSAFLAGYGAAQAVPGPLFTFAAYLGAVAGAPERLAGAAVGLVGIFLPGLLVLAGTLPFWERLRLRSGARAAMAGINAAVVGVLASALYDPVWRTSVGTGADFSIALLGFVLLTAWRAPPLLVVVLGALAGAVLPHAGA